MHGDLIYNKHSQKHTRQRQAYADSLCQDFIRCHRLVYSVPKKQRNLGAVSPAAVLSLGPRGAIALLLSLGAVSPAGALKPCALKRLQCPAVPEGSLSRCPSCSLSRCP